MPETSYPLREAAADLRARGQLAGVLVATAGHWRSRPADDETPLRGGFHGAALDSRRLRAGELFVAVPGERTDGRRFAADALAAGAAAVLAASGGQAAADQCWSGLATPREGAVVLLTGDATAALLTLAEKWRARLSLRLVGVTGTNGKTTTKDLLAAILNGKAPTQATAGNLNNALGLPLTLLSLAPEHRFAVIEMGASAVGEIARLARLARPEIGLITNASPAHLQHFGSLAAIVQGKGELLDALPAEGTAVLNAESPGCDAWVSRARCHVLTHGETAGDVRWRWRPAPDPNQGVLELAGRTWAVPLPGRHNGANLAAALLAAGALGVDHAAAAAGLGAFVASPHRSRVETIGGVLVLDDCYNANPSSVVSAASALVGLAGRRAVAVLGAMAELGTGSAELHFETGRRVAQAGVHVLVAVGPEAAPLAAGFRDAGGRAHALATREEAAAWLVRHAAAGDKVLIKGSRSSGMEAVLDEFRRSATGTGGL